MNTLSAQEAERYSRQMRLPSVGLKGQQRLQDASVLIVGAGGLGSPAALYLAASGVGRIGLVDFDRVDRSNLHRQILYADGDVGKEKVRAAAARLRGANPDIEIEEHAMRFTSQNARELVSGYDVVLDGTDEFGTRYLVNDACVLEGVPNVFASVSSYSGQLFVSAKEGPCYRCLFPAPPPRDVSPSCADAGILGVVPGVMGLLQATEATKWILGIGDPLVGRLLLVDLLSMRFRDIEAARDPECPVCGDTPRILTLDDSASMILETCSSPFDAMSLSSLTVQELNSRLKQGEDVFLLDVRSHDEHAFTEIGGVNIPLPELSNRWDELEPHGGDTIVVYCRSGDRSKVAVSMLRARGLAAVNLEGGLLVWSREIDPSVQTY